MRGKSIEIERQSQTNTQNAQSHLYFGRVGCKAMTLLVTVSVLIPGNLHDSSHVCECTNMNTYSTAFPCLLSPIPAFCPSLEWDMEKRRREKNPKASQLDFHRTSVYRKAKHTALRLCMFWGTWLFYHTLLGGAIGLEFTSQ